MIDTTKKEEEKKEEKKEEEPYKPKCNHGPGRKCLNCIGVTKDNAEFVKHGQCNHIAGVKCPNCVEKTSG